MSAVRKGLILPVLLLVLTLLGVLVAMFSFRVNADVAATRAVAYRLQTRLAAEAGIERVKLFLREGRFDVDAWYSNMDEFHRIIVWMHDGDDAIWGTNDEFDDDVTAYRFSIVADDPTDDEEYIRFGITDESSKLNLNTATEAQLLRLVRAATLGADEEVDPREIVAAILDWRDADRVPQGADGDTEGKFYRALPKPYRVRNGPFDTVEELLLVKGVTGMILYGEDFDRNGLLTDNEDDDDESFPPDNEDGVLNRGLYPYLTVLSVENNVDNNNRPRVYLLGEEAKLRDELSLVFPYEPSVVDFIVMATRSSAGGGKGAGSPPPGSGGKGPSKSGRRGSQPPADSAPPEDELGEEGETPEGADTSQPGEEATGQEPGGAEGKESGGGSNAMLSPASLLRERSDDGQQARFNNPLTVEHLPALMDHTTVVPPAQRTVAGLININTAPRLVLRCLDGLTFEQVEAIIDTRGSLSAEKKETTAWLLSEEVVELETFDKIAPFITARGQQFMIDSLGYADHIGTVTRLQVVVDMVGPIAQTVYYRDLTYLGAHFPIRQEDVERLRGR